MLDLLSPPPKENTCPKPRIGMYKAEYGQPILVG
jgi:hypothetical protein